VGVAGKAPACNRDYEWKKCQTEGVKNLYDYLYKQHHIAMSVVKDEEGKAGQFCRQRFEFDLANQYCAFFTGLEKKYIKGGAIFQSVFRIEDETFIPDGGRTAGRYDMEIDVGVDDESSIDGYLKDWGKDRITLSPQVTNITSTKNQDG